MAAVTVLVTILVVKYRRMCRSKPYLADTLTDHSGVGAAPCANLERIAGSHMQSLHTPDIDVAGESAIRLPRAPFSVQPTRCDSVLSAGHVSLRIVDHDRMDTLERSPSSMLRQVSLPDDRDLDLETQQSSWEHSSVVSCGDIDVSNIIVAAWMLSVSSGVGASCSLVDAREPHLDPKLDPHLDLKHLLEVETQRITPEHRRTQSCRELGVLDIVVPAGLSLSRASLTITGYPDELSIEGPVCERSREKDLEEAGIDLETIIPIPTRAGPSVQGGAAVLVQPADTHVGPGLSHGLHYSRLVTSRGWQEPRKTRSLHLPANVWSRAAKLPSALDSTES